MAYKRTTRKTGKNSRSTTTHNTEGPTTYSHSSSQPNVRYTQTSRDGKYYTTVTEKSPSGYVRRYKLGGKSRSVLAHEKRMQKNIEKAVKDVIKNGLGPIDKLLILGVFAAIVYLLLV
jgi:hypothetical protein